jgi:hypothetical protein
MANTLRFKRGLASGIPTAAAGEPLFTTDTFDLYIGNGTTNTRFQKYIASGATTQILRGDGSLYTFPLAISSPSNGQVLKYNGTSWVNDSDSGITGSLTTNYLPKATGATTLGNSLVYDNGTNVGIGTNTPKSSFEILGLNGNIRLYGTSGISNNQLSSNVYFDGSTWTRDNALNGATAIILNPSGLLSFHTTSNTTGFPDERFRVTPSGNLIIGSTTDSGEKLQVTGDMKVTGASVFSSTLLIGGNSLISNAVIGSGQLQIQSASYGSFNIYGTANSTDGSYIGLWKSRGANVVNNGDELGGIYFGGYDGSAYRAAANIMAVVDAVAGANDMPSSLLFKTTTDGSNSATTKMTLNNSGNLGLGVTPSAWGTSGIIAKAVQINNISLASTDTNGMQLSSNAYWDGSAWRYMASSVAPTNYFQGGGAHGWRTAASGTAGNAITFTQAMTLTAAGRLLLGTTTEATHLLDVNGSGRFANTLITLSSSNSVLSLLNNAANGKDWILQSYLNGEFYIGVNGVANYLTLGTTGAATFSSSVTATQFNAVNDRNFLGRGSFRLTSASDNASTLDISVTNGTTSIYSNYYGGGSDNTIIIATYANIGNQLVLKPSGNILIGSTSDSGEKLQVNGTAKITGASSFGGDKTMLAASKIIFNNTLNNSSTFLQNTGATGDSVLYSNGKISIGLTTIPSGSLLHVQGYMSIQNNLGYCGVSNTGGIVQILGLNSSNQTVIGTTSSGSVMTLTGTNVGIGITPSESLHVAGNMLISGANSFKMRNLAGTDVNVIRAVSGGTSVLSTATLGNNIAIGTQSAHDFLLCSSDTERIRLSSSGWFSHTNATNPSSSVTDSYVQYSADVTAGNAAPHFRTENGAVIKLYQETTAVGNSTISVGGGNAVLDDTEFGGYTLRQVVKALQNQGILA